jgi:site-specific DNA recombinase
MNVLGYIRVSSKRQVEGYSLRLQEDKIGAYCNMMDYTLVNVYRDEGITGMSIDKRNGFKDMLAFLKSNNINGVVVYSLSRLGRSMKDVVLFLNVLKENNIHFYSIKESMSNDDKVGGLIMNILASINEFEVQTIRERITDVKREKKRLGLVYGRLQYGYNKQNGKLVVNIDERKNITRVKNLRSRGWSWSRIAIKLNEDGVKTKRNGVWNMGSLYNMMQNYA